MFFFFFFLLFFFFFQAEDGIRDRDVTGVQTCALPICDMSKIKAEMIEQLFWGLGVLGISMILALLLSNQIGRASCRERV